MSTAVLLQILQTLVVLGLAPLYTGVLARAEAVVASKTRSKHCAALS